MKRFTFFALLLILTLGLPAQKSKVHTMHIWKDGVTIANYNTAVDIDTITFTNDLVSLDDVWIKHTFYGDNYPYLPMTKISSNAFEIVGIYGYDGINIALSEQGQDEYAYSIVDITFEDNVITGDSVKITFVAEYKTLGKVTVQLLQKGKYFEEENLNMRLAQAYQNISFLHDHWGYWGASTLSSDECVVPTRIYGDWHDGGYWIKMQTHNWTSSDEHFSGIWNVTYYGIEQCNMLLKQLNLAKDYISTDIYKRYTAELKVLRSYYYYVLLDSFGWIPYTEGDNYTIVAQINPWEVWKKLVLTLEVEAPNLPMNIDGNHGRCTQGMAYTLLARLYLNAASFGVTTSNNGIGINTEKEFYERCVTACQKVIDSGVYSIEYDYFTNFAIHNEYSKENIFTIIEDGSNHFHRFFGSMSDKLRITTLTLHYSHLLAWELREQPWNGFCCPTDFFAKYEYGKDWRGACDSTLGTHDRNRWGWFLGPLYAPNSDEILQDSYDKEPIVITSNIASLDQARRNDGARLIKYEVDKGGNYPYCENDYVLFRYADVLYMQYEAALRAGNTAKTTELLANAEFQRIRKRVNMPAYTSLDLDELLDERGREFAWELVRRRDLIRYNQFTQGEWQFKEKSDKSRDWFPIPEYIIRESQGLWKQNAGY